MTSTLGIKKIQYPNGTDIITLDSSGSMAISGALTGTTTIATASVTGNSTVGGTLGVTGQTTLTGGADITASAFDDAGGHLKVGGQLRPVVNFRGTWGRYNQTFTSGEPSNYTDTTGRHAFPPFNGVFGQNTTGATTSSTPGSCYYTVPYSGAYIMSFAVHLNTSTSNHFDTAFNIQSANAAAGGSSNSYEGPAGGAFGTSFEGLASYTDFTDTNNLARGGQVSGFSRSVGSSGQGATPLTIITYLQKGMRIRPMISMNTSVTINIYLVNHSYWHIMYMGR